MAGTLWRALRAVTVRDSACTGNGLRSVGSTRVLPEMPFSSPGKFPLTEGRVFFLPSAFVSCIRHCPLSVSLEGCLHLSLSLHDFPLFVWFYFASWFLSTLVILLVCLSLLPFLLGCVLIFLPLSVSNSDPNPAPHFSPSACFHGSSSSLSVLLSAWLHLCGSTHGPDSSGFSVK